MHIFLLLIMLFAHIVDDYYLQGWLAEAKQKFWWEENAPNDLYKNDYKMALAEHAFSWSFMVHLPIMIMLIRNGQTDTKYIMVYIACFVANWILHAVVDHHKANLLRINLVEDQMIHIFQIAITWVTWAGMFR